MDFLLSVNSSFLSSLFERRRSSGDAMVLGKLPVPLRPTRFDNGRARVYCAWSRCGWVLFLSSVISLLFLTLWEIARYRLKYCLKGPLNPKQPTSQSSWNRWDK